MAEDFYIGLVIYSPLKFLLPLVRDVWPTAYRGRVPEGLHNIESETGHVSQENG